MLCIQSYVLTNTVIFIVLFKHTVIFILYADKILWSLLIFFFFHFFDFYCVSWQILRYLLCALKIALISIVHPDTYGNLDFVPWQMLGSLLCILTNTVIFIVFIHKFFDLYCLSWQILWSLFLFLKMINYWKWNSVYWNTADWQGIS